jgi:hypothetical protein
LPDKPPYVAPEDKDKVLAFNLKQRQRGNQQYVLDLDLIPEPFVGRPDAPVVLLGNNPGVKNPDSAASRRQPPFANRMRNNLFHRLSEDFPFLYLDPHPDIPTPSREWWERKLKDLLREFGREIVARSILAVEFFPYVSQKYARGSPALPSQAYSFDLVRNAMKRKAVIVVTRGKRRWSSAIDGLAEYPDLVRLREPQKAPISSGNCRDDGFQKIVSQIRAELS